MKKILIVITKAEIGGAQKFVLNLTNELQKHGFLIILGCGEAGYLTEEIEKSGIKIHFFKYLRRTFNPFKNILFSFELYGFCKKNNISIVHLNSSNSLVGAYGSNFAGSKSIATIHGLSFLDPNHTGSVIKKMIYRFLFKILLAPLDQVIFVSKNNLQYAQKINLTKKGLLIYNEVNSSDFNFFSKIETREFFKKKTNFDFNSNFIIGSIGRYAYPKNYEFLIKNFKAIQLVIPVAKLLIIGEGPDRKKYEDIISKLSLKNEIFLVGEIKHASRYLKGFDLFLLPSLYEGTPYVLLEALAARIPILASRVGGIPEFLNEENMFSPNKINELTNQLINLKNKGFSNSNSINLPTKESSIYKYVELYNNILRS